MKPPKNMDDFFANLAEMFQDLNPNPTTKKSGWGGVLSTGLGLAGNIISTAMTNRANREMQREANEQNERLWREQMEYNSPVNQIQRMRAAKLNPNLAYGDNGNAGASPEYISSKNQAPQFDPMAIANALLVQKQMEQMEVEKELSLASAEKLRQEAKTIEDDRNYKPVERSIWSEVQRASAREMNSNADYMAQRLKTEIENTGIAQISKQRAQEELDEYKKLAPLREKQLRESINEAISRRAKNQEEANYLRKMANYVLKQESILGYQEQLYKLWLEPSVYDGRGGYISYAEKEMHSKSLMGELEQQLLSNEVILSNAGFDAKLENAQRESEYQNTWWSIFWDEYVGSVTSSIGKVFNASTGSSSSVVKKLPK